MSLGKSRATLMRWVKIFWLQRSAAHVCCHTSNCQLFVLSPSHFSPNIFQQIGLLDYTLSSSQFAAAQDSAPQVAISFFSYPDKGWVQKLCLFMLLHTKYLSMRDGIKQRHFLLCRTGYTHFFPWFSSTLQFFVPHRKGLCKPAVVSPNLLLFAFPPRRNVLIIYACTASCTHSVLI